jgi:hypothetical protein
MAIRLHCRACGKRLKLPAGVPPGRSARCPKCLAPVDLAPALEAAAYSSALALPLPPASKPGTAPEPPKPAPPAPKPPPLIGEDDPLPYDPLPYPIRPSAPAKTGPTPAPPPTRGAKPLAPDPGDDPLPSPTAPTRGGPPKPAPDPATRQEPLSLDDDPEPAELPAELTAELTPFRVPVRVLADSLRQLAGPYFAVIVPHGIFLEHEPMRPFLYFPVGCAADSPAGGDLTVVLPDRRAVTLRFGGRSGRALARDARDFLAGERPAPAAADYRRKWWMLWSALIFALGLAGGPLALSQTAGLGREFGLEVGAGFALAGLAANAAVVLFSRRSAFVQVLTMAALCLLATGVFLFGATAYLAGRQKAAEEARPEHQPQPAPPHPPIPEPKPPEPPPRPPSHLDLARKNGSSALPDGPAAVTALALSPDGNSLGIGYADGTVRLWPLDQPTFEAMQPGPKADGPVLRVQFDRRGAFVFAHTATGAFAAPRAGPPPVVAKIPGTPVAVAPEVGERVRFAAVRGNAVLHRLLDAGFVRNPPVGKGKKSDYAVPNPKSDEIIPKDRARDPARPAGLTFLAWGPGDRLFAGQPSGTISIWSSAMRPEAPSRDHKAAVRAWAECPATGGFATGDEKGSFALWPLGGGRPVLWPVFDGATITGLSFNADGSRLVLADNTGWLVIWDAVAGKVVHRVKRPAPVKALAYGPGNNVVILAAGRTAEVWWLPVLLK